ncbi:hypothetical protein [Massilia sp. TS11]|uniref:hypothetical protein n=1 Tax=Massilia sp. TS11 TaxID=2908003 RepID=UPI001EDC03A4|nr:hypothetical protein [Massilia sp. TS11]MCG2586665.1 hypothetical protein [Massilia sp. TS11]
MSDDAGEMTMERLHAMYDKMLDETVRIPGQPAWIMLCGYAIGETAEFCALAKAFVEHHGHGIILLITPKHVSVANMYAHRFLKVVVVPDEHMHAMLRSGYIPQDRFELDQPISACWIDRGFRDSDGIKYLGRYPERGGISETDMMRFVLRLPWNAKLEAPYIAPEAEQRAMALAQEKGLRLGRSVLLCPINNSARRFPDLFWSTVAARLQERGYTVFTNMGGLKPHNGPETMPVQGTIPVDLPIELVIPFAHLCGRMISGGNGMCFLTFLGNLKSFKMTQILPVSKDVQVGHSSLGFRAPYQEKGGELISAFQYLSPELCLDAPLSEYLLQWDADEATMVEQALMVADDNTSDARCIKRLAGNGRPYIEEHADWLRDLA